uniref:Intraflagellar transport 88 homolog n=1 Tax=Cyprinus carpio carpio TaxID=630221 RepID=A0A9J7ZW31_CYPCA
MGLIEVQNYATKLKKVEKIREQRVRSGREGSARGLREGSTGSVSHSEAKYSPVLEQGRVTCLRNSSLTSAPQRSVPVVPAEM